MRTIGKSGLHLALAALCCFARMAPASAQTYTITDISVGQGNDSMTPYGLNNLGEAVGFSETGGGEELFSNGALTIINSTFTPYGINAAGEIVGESPPTDSSGDSDASIYVSGKTTDINSRTLFAYGSYATAVNASGQVVGTGYPSAALAPPFHAFLYSGGKMIDINPPGSWSSIGTAINDSGQVIGSWSPASGTGGGNFLYSNGKFVTLPDSTTTGAYAINNAGQIAGSISTSTGIHAALYSDGAWTDLGAIAGATFGTIATGIDTSGEIVGIAYFPKTGTYQRPIAGKRVAFVIRNGAPVDLNTLVTPNSGYTIEAPDGAVCINASGQILCSAKTPAGEIHAVLLTPN